MKASKRRIAQKDKNGRRWIPTLSILIGFSFILVGGAMFVFEKNVQAGEEGPEAPTPEIRILDFWFEEKTVFDIYHPFYVEARGLEQHSAYHTYLVDETTIEPNDNLENEDIRGGGNGILTGFFGTCEPTLMFEAKSGDVGNYYVVLDSDDDGIYDAGIDAQKSITISDITTDMEVYMADDSGNRDYVVETETDFYVKGNGFLANDYVDIYVVYDTYDYYDHKPLYDLTDDGINTVQTNFLGILSNTNIGSCSEGLQGDIVIDIDQDGHFNPGDDYITDGYGTTIGDGGTRGGDDDHMQMSCINNPDDEGGRNYPGKDIFDVDANEIPLLKGARIWEPDTIQLVNIWIYPMRYYDGFYDGLIEIKYDETNLSKHYSGTNNQYGIIKYEDQVLDSCGNIPHRALPVCYKLQDIVTAGGEISITKFIVVDRNRNDAFNANTASSAPNNGDFVDGRFKGQDDDRQGYSITATSIGAGRRGSVNGDGIEQDNVLEVSCSDNLEDNIAYDGVSIEVIGLADSPEYEFSVDFSNICSNYNTGDEYTTSWGNDNVDNDQDWVIDEWDEQGIYGAKYTVSETNTKSDGSYSVALSFEDSESREMTNLITIELDNTISSASITSPSNNAELSGTETIEVDSDFDAVYSTLYYYQDTDGNDEPDDGNEWTFVSFVMWCDSNEIADDKDFEIDWDTTTVDNDDYILAVYVYDDAGLKDADTVVVDVAN